MKARCTTPITGADTAAGSFDNADPTTVIGSAVEKLVAAGAVLEPGTVWLVGAGPGDPGYLTVNAIVALSQADVVIYDALIDKRVLELASAEAEIVYAGKRAGRHSIDQAGISDMLVQRAKAGQRVLRLKGGDPMVFGRGGEEIVALAQAQIPFRIVPGVTAGLAAMAVAKIPATLRDVNRAFVFATGHEANDTPETDWLTLARLNQPIVLYMALRRLDSIAETLMSGGMPGDTPLAVISAATLSNEDVLVSTLAQVANDLDQQPVEAPAIIVIGDNVSMRRRLRMLAPAAAEALR